MNIINIDHLLNQYVADVAVIFIKLHNIHWNIIGKDFLELHEYTEELYNYFFKSYDEFAEILKIKNKSVYGSMQDYLKVSTLRELGTSSLKSDESLKIIRDDFNMLLITLKKLKDFAYEEKDITISLIVENEIKFLEKQVWFISTMLS
jgi:starvation-inducible DNA-binding protein